LSSNPSMGGAWFFKPCRFKKKPKPCTFHTSSLERTTIDSFLPPPTPYDIYNNVCFSGWNTYQKEAPVPGAGITLLPASVLKSHNKCGGSMYSKCTCTRQLALCVNVKKSFKASFLPFVDFLLEQCWYFLMVTSRRIELEIVFS
jgi:hypothetical protein